MNKSGAFAWAMVLLVVLLVALSISRSTESDVVVYDVACFQNGTAIFHGEVTSEWTRVQTGERIILPFSGCVWIELYHKSLHPVTPTPTKLPRTFVQG
jgi:hypothetical protein